MLTAYPCADKHNDVTTISSNSQAHSQHNHSHDEETDLCSPFCVCNCCGQSVLSYVPAIVFNFHTPTVEIQTLNSIYKSNLYSNFFGGIWQPPQLV